MNIFTVTVEKPEASNFILGVVDGCSPKGVEGEQDVLARLRFLRRIGYKLG